MSNNDEELSTEDLDWQDILSGKQVPNADPDTERDAKLLRLAILNKENIVPANQEQRLNALLEQIRQADTTEHLPQPSRFSTWAGKLKKDLIDLFYAPKFLPIMASMMFVSFIMGHVFTELNNLDDLIRKGRGSDLSFTTHHLPPQDKPIDYAWQLQYKFRQLGVKAYVGHNQDDEHVWEILIPLNDGSEANVVAINELLVQEGIPVQPGFGLLLKVADYYINPIPNPNPELKALNLQADFELIGANTKLTQLSDQAWRLDVQLPDLKPGDVHYGMLEDLMAGNNLHKSIGDYVRIEIELEKDW